MNENFQKAYETQLQHSDEWLRNLRAKNFKQFLTQGFPSKRIEEWKYTDVSQIAKKEYQLAKYHSITLTDNILHHCLPDAYTLMFIDGYYLQQTNNNLPSNIILTNLLQGLKKYPEKIKTYLEKNSTTAFELLNTALLQDGAFIYIPRNIILEKPIQLLFFTTATNNHMQHLRNLILVEENSAVNIIETYIGEGQQNYFNNNVSKVFVEKNSKLNYFKNQNETQYSTHISKIDIYQQANSSVKTYNFSFGAALARDDLNIRFQVEGAECGLYGLYLTDNQQHIDHHTSVDHLVPHCNSYELYKGIMNDKSRAVFNGKVTVHRDAQQTRTQQINQNILLTKTAEINTKPELEIYADNVQCTHGATVGQIDEQALFYLRSRGIDSQKAVQILTFAFASEVTDVIPISNIKEYINNYLRLKLKKFY